MRNANKQKPEGSSEDKGSSSEFRVLGTRRATNPRREPESAAFREGAKLAQETIKEIRAALAVK